MRALGIMAAPRLVVSDVGMRSLATMPRVERAGEAALLLYKEMCDARLHRGALTRSCSGATASFCAIRGFRRRARFAHRLISSRR